jgi:hypothetical protein
MLVVSSSSLVGCLDPVRRVQAKPLRGRFASLDTGQVTRWKPWHRWSALHLLAFMYLAVAAALDRDSHSDLDTGLIPVTIPEMLRMLRGTVVPPPRRDHGHRQHWSQWRRRLQLRGGPASTGGPSARPGSQVGNFSDQLWGVPGDRRQSTRYPRSVATACSNHPDQSRSAAGQRTNKSHVTHYPGHIAQNF